MKFCCKKKSDEDEDEEPVLAVYKLKKDLEKAAKSSTSGMKWRSDPTEELDALTEEECTTNFPRTNSVIEGLPLKYKEEEWLKALYVRHENTQKWLEVPEGAHFPFEYEAYSLAKLNGKGPTMIEEEEGGTEGTQGQKEGENIVEGDGMGATIDEKEKNVR